MYFVCSYSKKIYNNIKKPITFSDIGKPLEVRYNWEGVKKDIGFFILLYIFLLYEQTKYIFCC